MIRTTPQLQERAEPPQLYTLMLDMMRNPGYRFRRGANHEDLPKPPSWGLRHFSVVVLRGAGQTDSTMQMPDEGNHLRTRALTSASNSVSNSVMTDAYCSRPLD
jgi:hypothetical protein